MEPGRWQQVCDLFDAALGCAPGDRRALLDAIADAELRSEVESLLAAHEASGPLDRLASRMSGLRNEALASRFSAPRAGPGPAADGLAPGQRLGRHEIRGRLGAGGMGEVYRAYDTRLQREVAIKILGPWMPAHPGALARFEQEARAASALNHPNIITLHDIGEDPSSPYIVMELVDGQSVRQMLHGPWPAEVLLLVATQVADGLVAAHERDIVHRDLKPENVLVTRQWVVKIVDFGLAQFRAAAEGHGDEDRPGLVRGTLGYVAPELLAGAPADPRSDQFSLGAILYEMATGAPAFRGATTLETLTSSVRRDPRPLADVRPDLPPALVDVIDRCLRKDPAERFGSTRELLEALRAVRHALAPRAARPGAPRRPAPLPAARTRLIGRERDVEEIRRLVLGGVRLLTLTGAGGTGKTRLALRAAEALEPEFPGGVIFVPLATITDPELVVTAIAQAMGVAFARRSALAGIIGELRTANAPALLVLDNFEQVIGAAPVVSELLAACPDLKILVTSREVLHLYGEHGFAVAPLELPGPATPRSPAALAENPAVALFVERARAVHADFRLTAENARAVAALCTGLDGLPLALELAAAHVRVLSPDAMVTRLDHRLGLLSGGARDLPGRQHTLRRTIDWSHQLLSEQEKAAFRRLASFAGGFTVEAAQAVVDPFDRLGLPMEEVVAALAEKSLLHPREPLDGEPRFSMLETLREYALERLVESGERNATRRAHAAYYLVLAEEGSAALGASEDAGWLARFEAEHDNFRAAIEWLTQRRELEWGLRLAVALFHFWERGEHLVEGRRRLDALLALDPSGATPSLRARALFDAGVLASTQRDFDRGERLHRESLDTYRALGDRQGVAVSLVAVANQRVAAGDHDGARGFLEQSLTVWQELGDRAGFARSLSNLSFVARSQGRFEEARALCQRAAELFGGVGDPLSRAWAVNQEGDVARDQGDLAAAEALYRRALLAFRELGDRWGIGSSLADLGNVARLGRAYDDARRLYAEALASFARLDHWRGLARVLESLACLAADEQQGPRGLRLAASAAALRARIGAPAPPAVEREVASSLSSLRRTVEPETARAAWVEGGAMSVEEAIRYAAGPPA